LKTTTWNRNQALKGFGSKCLLNGLGRRAIHCTFASKSFPTMSVKIVFLVLPHTHLLDLAGPDQAFFEAMGFGADLTIEYCGLGKEVQSSAGLPFGKLPHFTGIALKSGDFLIIPGTERSYLNSTEFAAETYLMAWIRDAYTRQVRICSICSGSFVLAQSGVLNGKTCTTHWKRTTELQASFPQLRVAENVLFTEQDGIYTSAGIASGIDMALHILEVLYGEMFAHKVARELVIYNRRSGHQPQKSVLLDFRNHIHTGIHKVQDWLQEHLDQKTTLLQLAEIACMSDRNFTRTFKKETGLTVNGYITVLRKQKIQELLQNPDQTRSLIAQQCGLKSERHVLRIMQKA
jgi:transcriptional regulator GlxA family with amidase domain